FKKYSLFPLFCLSIYFISSFGFNIEALRQIIAVAIFYIALSYYLNGKKKHYIALCLLASSFHISAIILIILPFIDNAIFKRLRKLVCCLV
ncbi:EpsG family protein, partial [Yersinia rochesterensis]|uniref:EpsG family protein n=1 Tax=Yersinia rochesterensis TaxID=1604335 RepID=UPI001643DC78